MKIFEIFSQNPEEEKPLDFDLRDDLIYFIKSDHDLYKKEFFPLEIKLKKLVQSGEESSPAMFKNLVTHAYNAYYNKFQDQESRLEKKLPLEELKEICKKIYSELIQELKESQRNKKEN